MNIGGRRINQRTVQIIRFSGFVTPIALTLYGVLIMFHVVDDSHFYSSSLFLGLMVIWMGLASYQFLASSRNQIESAIRFGLYHLFAIVYLVCVSGFSMPFLAVWIVLLLAVYAYFGIVGSQLSIVVLVVATLIDIFLHDGSASIMMNDLISLLAVLVVGISVISINHNDSIDATELDRSRELESLQRDRILTIVNNLADAILSTDRYGLITVYNAASLNLLDTNQKLDGRKLSDAIELKDSDDKPFDLFAQLQSARGVVVRDDLTYQVGEDVLRLEVTYSPIRSSYSRSKGAEEHDGYIIIMRDVTKAKSLEEERDEFISVVSHELRTPITIAEGTISNLQLMNKRGMLTKEKSGAAIESTHAQILFLASMVNDLSTLSRAERGVADAAELIDVRTMANDLYNQYSPEAKNKGLRLNLDIEGKLDSVFTSRLYLQELLQNFITNSIKYTKEGSITVEIARKKDQIVFTVRDTGIGMSKTDQEKIFGKFYRAEDYRTRESSGTGLGLYVSAKLSKKIGTKIELTSRLNHGSSFSFSLPVAKPEKK